jgi:HK97 family phage portal protein
MITTAFNDAGYPIEVAPGQGDLRRSSYQGVVPIERSLRLVNRHVSFSLIFASQPLIAAAAGWLIRQSKRVPLRAFRQVEGDSAMLLRPDQHPLAAMLRTPWERAGQVHLVSALLGSYVVHGNAIAPVESGARNQLRMKPADWRFVMPLMPWRGEIAGWEIDTDDPAEKKTLGVAEVLHAFEWGPLGPFGISPLQQLGTTIAIDDAAQRHQRNQLANGVRTATAIKTVDERFFGLSPEERKELMDNFRQDIDEIMAGPENAGRPWLLPPGLDVTPFGQTATEAQLVEQRTVNRTEAIALYGITPATQGVIERSAELPEQRQMATVEGLAPILILIEACINAQIAIGLLNEPDIYVEFDFTQILRGDFLREIEALRDAVSSAIYTPNEAREQVGKQRSSDPAMDKHYLPRNNLIPTDVPYKAKGEGELGAGEGTAEAAPALNEGED